MTDTLIDDFLQDKITNLQIYEEFGKHKIHVLETDNLQQKVIKMLLLGGKITNVNEILENYSINFFNKLLSIPHFDHQLSMEISANINHDELNNLSYIYFLNAIPNLSNEFIETGSKFNINNIIWSLINFKRSNWNLKCLKFLEKYDFDPMIGLLEKENVFVNPSFDSQSYDKFLKSIEDIPDVGIPINYLNSYDKMSVEQKSLTIKFVKRDLQNYVWTVNSTIFFIDLNELPKFDIHMNYSIEFLNYYREKTNDKDSINLNGILRRSKNICDPIDKEYFIHLLYTFEKYSV